MSRYRKCIRDFIVTIVILGVTFLINLVLQRIFKAQSFSSDVFILGVFLISLKTEGYLWGIAASLVSVLAENFAFTFPYFALDFVAVESLSSAIVMLVVATATSALTTKIKEQERTKAETEKERVRANLLRAISHDLRTPLTTIYGSCSAIIENYDSLKKEQQIKLLGEIREDAEWLIRMMENLLSITKIGSKQVQVIKTPTVLEELIDDTLIKFHKRYPDQKVEVEIPEEFISIPMDPLLIVQVLMNLLENAVLHAKGMTRLIFRVRTVGSHAVFEIEDDGCGIAPELLDRLFEGYQERTEEPADGKRNNMSIGLSVCATIIRAHGGSIKAENRREGGARFSFSLEMEEMDEQQI
ncbi:MAG TPA: DUF4118 domain-containing protein [Candidatus Anaerobutyricum avicola]|nr:DUF4118 domain-containing protein [Candidatus Anaerobutyricum avicola]